MAVRCRATQGSSALPTSHRPPAHGSAGTRPRARRHPDARRGRAAPGAALTAPASHRCRALLPPSDAKRDRARPRRQPRHGKRDDLAVACAHENGRPRMTTDPDFERDLERLMSRVKLPDSEQWVPAAMQARRVPWAVIAGTAAAALLLAIAIGVVARPSDPATATATPLELRGPATLRVGVLAPDEAGVV